MAIQYLRSRAGVVMVVGFLVLSAAWLMGNPPSAAPDEPSHYLRALAVGRLDFIGEPTNIVSFPPQNAVQADYLRRTRRSVLVPAGLAVPEGWFCTVGHRVVSAACVAKGGTNSLPVRQVTAEGFYPPFVYLPMGLAMRLARTATGALMMARTANALISYAFFVAAILLLWDRRSPLSLIGVPLALTPFALFMGTVLNPSGPEIGAAAALLAFALRLTRSGPLSRWAWPTGIVAAAVLCLARPLGPGWVVLMLGIGVLLGGRKAAVNSVRSAPHAAAVGAATTLTCTAAVVGWQLAFLPPGHRPVVDVVANLLPSLVAVPEVFGETIGVFGWQDTLMPGWAYAVWGLALLLVLVPALLRGRLRERRALDLVIVGFALTVMLVSALVLLPTGFDVQGRHVMPTAMAMPMVAGEILYRNRARAGEGSLARLMAVSGVLAALIQFVGWYANAHRYAVGTGGPALFAIGDWNPAGGWPLWFAVAACGAGMLAVAAASGLQTTGSEPGDDPHRAQDPHRR